MPVQALPAEHAISMHSMPPLFRVLVIGSSGGLGSAFVAVLKNHPNCGQVIGTHRNSQPAIDFGREESIAQAAEDLAQHAPFHLIINAAGVLHTETFSPEKKLSSLNYAQMEETFRTNALGPAMVLNHFSKLLDPTRGVIAMISAKVGSIEDNRLGGWYSYRASKAALNMFLKTAAIELKRTQPNSVVVALHPGTVNTGLSRPFGGQDIGRSALVAAGELLTVIDRLQPSDSGRFYAYGGSILPW